METYESNIPEVYLTFHQLADRRKAGGIQWQVLFVEILEKLFQIS